MVATFPELRDLGLRLGSRPAIIDGEIVALDSSGRPPLRIRRQASPRHREGSGRATAQDHSGKFFRFRPLVPRRRVAAVPPYDERRAQLESLELNGDTFTTPPSIVDNKGVTVLDIARERGLEGVVLKRRDAVYAPGRKKRRLGQSQDLCDPRGGHWRVDQWQHGERAGSLGALLLGVHDGEALRYVGKVGTGFDRAERESMMDLLAPLTRKSTPFSSALSPAETKLAHFVRPRWLERFASRNGPGMSTFANLRGAAFGPIRTRKTYTEKTERVATEVDGKQLSLSNLDKVLYPDAGFTKGQVLDYYARVADAMLPHLQNRPVTLRRYPNGVDGMSFFEKHAPATVPDWVRTTDVPSKKRRSGH